MNEGWAAISWHFVMAYRDAFRLLRERVLLVVVVILAMGGGIVLAVLARPLFGTDLGRTLASVLCSLVGTYLATPYLIALYRFVGLGERIERPEALRSSREAQVFFAWSALFGFLAILPDLAGTVFDPVGPVIDDGVQAVSLAGSLAYLAMAVAVFVVTIRSITLLPSIALGRIVSLGTAWQDSRGRFWLVVFASTLPVLALMVGLVILAAILTGGGEVAAILGVPLAALASILALPISIAVNTRLAQRLVGPDLPGGAIPPR